MAWIAFEEPASNDHPYSASFMKYNNARPNPPLTIAVTSSFLALSHVPPQHHPLASEVFTLGSDSQPTCSNNSVFHVLLSKLLLHPTSTLMVAGVLASHHVSIGWWCQDFLIGCHTTRRISGKFSRKVRGVSKDQL